MSKPLLILSIFTFSLVIGISSGCHEDTPPECEHKAYFLGTTVCPVMDGEVGLQIDEQSYIATNFSDFAVNSGIVWS